MVDNEKKALYEFIGVKICATISIIPCLLLIIIYMLKKKLTLSMYINLNLCITAILYSISGLFPSLNKNDSKSFICTIQVFSGATGDISILLWTGSISVIGTISYKYQESIENNQLKIKTLVTFIVYGIVLVFNFIFKIFGDIGNVPNTKYCWINNYYIKMSYTILIFVIFIINIVANVILIIEVNEIKKSIYDNENLMKKLNKFSFILWKYIFALILIFLSNIIHFIQNLKARIKNKNYEELPLPIDVFLQCFNFLKGLIACFIYTYNDEFYDDLLKLLKCEISKIKDEKEISFVKDTEVEEMDKNYYNAIDFFDSNDNCIELPL